ncbi:MAG: ATP-binding protein [Deferribacterales bacterium]
MKLNGIFARLIITNFIPLVFLSMFMSFIFFKIQKLDRLMKQVTLVEIPVIEKTDRLSGTILRQIEFREKYIISMDKDFLRQYEEYTGSFRKMLAELDAVAAGERKQQALAKLRTAYDEYSHAEAVYIRDGGKGSYVPSVNSVSGALEELRGVAASKREKALKTSGRLVEQVRTEIFLFIVTGGVLIVCLAYLNTRSIALPIRKLSENTRRVAKGTYPDHIGTGGPSEIRRLSEDFGTMVRRLKESDELRTEFIGNVSHELRTPLTSIYEASSMLKEDYFINDRESSEKLLNIIETESKRMINSVSNILEITRLDIEQDSYIIAPVDIGRAAVSSIEKTAPIAAGRGISVVSDIRPGEMVYADGEKLSLVFMNLIGNALKYSGDGSFVKVTAERKDSLLTVCVSDNGTGIDAEELSLIFERYRQGSNRSAEYKGTGLGLAICRKIIEKHGGTIWAESQKGCGSRFFFTLRCA